MERISSIDDGGSFEKLMEEVKKGADDESKVMELLQLKILTAFVNKIKEDAINDHYFKKEEKSTNNNNALLDTFAPKKKKSSIEDITLKNSSLQHSHGKISSRDVEDDLKIKKRVSRKRRFDSEDSEEEEKEMRITKKVKIIKKPKKVERVDFKNLGLWPPPVMPNKWKTIIDKINGKDVQLLIMKQMFKTDLSKHHDRLSIPCKQIINNNFLDETEEKDLNVHQKTLTVKLMEPCGSVSEMILRHWNLRNTSNYALTTSWNSVLERNLNKEFKQNDIMQLWSFRVDKKLWLALIKVWDAPCDNDIAVGTSSSSSTSGCSSSCRRNGDGTSHGHTVVDQEQC